MKYAFDTNIYQIWRNINDPAIKKIAKHEGISTASDVLDTVLGSSWHVVYETEDIHKEAMMIGSTHGGLGAADLLLAAIARQEDAAIVTIDSDFNG